MALVPRETQMSVHQLFSQSDERVPCARYRLGRISSWLNDNKTDNKTFTPAISKHFDFWNSLMQYIFADRTKEQVEQLLEDIISCCSCPFADPNMSKLHEAAKSTERFFTDRPGSEGLHPAMGHILYYMNQIATVLPQAHIRPVSKGCSVFWPPSPKELMPHGPEKLISSLIQWTRFTSVTAPYRLAGEFIRLGGSLVIPRLIEQGFAQYVVEAGRRLADYTSSALHNAGRLSNQSRLGLATALLSQAEDLIYYYTQAVEEQSFMDWKIFTLHACEIKTVQVFSLLAYIVSDPRLPFVPDHRAYLLSKLEIKGASIHRLAQVRIVTLPEFPVHPGIYRIVGHTVEPPDVIQRREEFAQRSTERLNSRFNALQLITEDTSSRLLSNSMLNRQNVKTTVSYIRYARQELLCSAIGCPNTIHSTGKEFQRCARCNIVLYCGKDCQTVSWFAQPYPHKKICKILVKLIRTGGGEDLFFLAPRPEDPKYYPDELRNIIVDNWEAGGITNEEVSFIADWRLAVMMPVPLVALQEFEPGYDDYEALVEEFSQRDESLKARCIPQSMWTAQAILDCTNNPESAQLPGS
ncbi:hypothetical protein GALMADRAFT_133486 [Galerina marginata CBS 339.88]|uniref:MYND-type domain-containing protein n=1 Tax=Galerina marginata (strain CBS 339.88) TaxID=685588 RepID=A0A067TLM7_GALM3|nr:hypothetical protein GALMADRAFT_133486 [Galerina marginata CBS 339.88]